MFLNDVFEFGKNFFGDERDGLGGVAMNVFLGYSEDVRVGVGLRLRFGFGRWGFHEILYNLFL